LPKSVDLDPRILREFRAALGHARHTAWALEQWVELQSKNADVLPVVAYLNSERIRIATYLCRNLAAEIAEVDVNRHAVEFENLLRAVEELFQRLADFRFAMDERTEMSAPFPEPPKAEEEEELRSLGLAEAAEADDAEPSLSESAPAAEAEAPAPVPPVEAGEAVPVTALATALTSPLVEDRRSEKNRRRVKKHRPAQGNQDRWGHRKDRRG
jgi:hypothetical protein